MKILSRPPKSKSKRTDYPSGYLFVDALDEKNVVRYRYNARIEEPWQKNKKFLKGYFRSTLEKMPSIENPPRYGITYEDISTDEDRRYWIAGSSLKIVDLQTSAIIAERIGYMFDPAQGSKMDGREPWLMAAGFACPVFGPFPASLYQTEQTIRFAEKVLRPQKEK